jgi:TonB family protein
MAVTTDPTTLAPDVFSASDLARATGASPVEIAAWIEAGMIRPLQTRGRGVWLSAAEAVRAGRAIRRGTTAATLPIADREAEEMFGAPTESIRAYKGPLALSTSLHAGLVAAIVLATTLGLGQASAVSDSEPVQAEKMRLVFLALPGPGGGGGGGGLKQKLPPPKAKREGTRHIDSPLPVREKPVVPEPQPKPPDPEPPKVEPEPLPPVEAPVVAIAADNQTRPGALEQSPAETPSRGPGDGGGVGTGTGVGLGEGDGSGIGDGSGGGTGGGPYRPGSGIEPPSLLKEVKPDYSEEARRRGVEGDVVMEIVVRRDGSVGDVRVLQGLGQGLDERAIAAVRRWRFAPATRRGVPVDVLVEVAMEFKLR